MNEYFIGENDFRVFIPNLLLSERSGDAYNSRRITGVMSTERKDRQDEVVLSEGLDFSEFIELGHFNDNHSQLTSAIVGYPEDAKFHKNLEHIDPKLKSYPGWTCEGYILKGTRRSDDIWELAKTLTQVPNRKLGFSIEGKVIRRSDKCIEKAKIRNVAITNCFPGDTEVIGSVDKITRRFYSGPMVEICLASGEKLTGTPNHPIFTDRGWIPLYMLDEQYDRIGRIVSDVVSPSISVFSHNIQNMPSSLEQIFDFASLSGTGHRVRFTGKTQFHGDGRDGDVDIVLADSFLKHGLHSMFLQQFGEDALATTDKKLALLSGSSPGFDFTVTGSFLSTGNIGGFGESLSFGGASSRVSKQLFFSSSSGYPFAPSDVENSYSGDAITFGDCGRTLSHAVGFSNLISKRVFNFRGHVFNSDTGYGWYSANNIIAHNCPVNTDATWNVLEKSFFDSDVAIKAMSAGHATSPSTQSDGGALRIEDLDDDVKENLRLKKKKRLERALMDILGFDELVKAMEYALERRNDLTDDAAAMFAKCLIVNERKL